MNVVRLGELDFESGEDDASPRDYNVAEYITHPGYEDPRFYHDIGLIMLGEKVVFDLYKHPACLPSQDERSADSFIAVGWGSTGLVGTPSSMLQKVMLDRYGNEVSPSIHVERLNLYRSLPQVCQKLLSRQLEEFPEGFNAKTQLCVGSEMARDTCNGDSGGPLLMYHKDFPCMYNVIGITSAGLSCGTPGIPGVYTRVFPYLDWITQTLSKY